MPSRHNAVEPASLIGEQSIVLQATSREILPLLSFNQRCGLFDQVIRAIHEGRRPRIFFSAEISVSDLLTGFVNDSEPAPRTSEMMGLPVTDRGEIAAAAAARLSNF